MHSAAELLTKHVIVDLETTGLNPASDEVIEVGALFIEKGEPMRRVSRLFRARAPLPLAIRRITGLRDEDLAAQPAFEEFIPQMRASLEGWTVVAHNAAFECSFLSQVLEPIAAPILDSCELLHYLFPELPSHSLEALVAWAGIGTEVAHRALRDCEDTWAVLAFAIERCSMQGRVDDLTDLLEVLEPQWNDAPAQTPITRLLVDLRALTQSHPPPLTWVESSPFLPNRPDRMRRVRASAFSTASNAAPVVPVTGAEVADVLGPGGALEREWPQFHSRPAQLEMATAVAQALSDGGILAVEAAPGTGKSLAYLAPAALFAVTNGRRVGIAAPTQALQEQLLEKDLPLLHRATRGAFGFAVLKSQTHYLCRRRALENTRAGERMTHAERAPRAYLRAYLRRSEEGDLDRLSYWFRDRYPRLNELALTSRSEAATTLSEGCPHFHRCFFHSAIAQAQAADVIVIKQSLALSWPAGYPAVDELVLDEAHHLEDGVTRALSVEVSRKRLDLARNRLGALGPRLAQTGDATAAIVRDLVASLAAALNALATAAMQLAQDRSPGDGGQGLPTEVRIDEAAMASSTWASFERAFQTVGAWVSQASAALTRARASEGDSWSPALERDVAGAEAELSEIEELFDEMNAAPQASRCRTLEVKGSGFTVSIVPVDVSPFLRGEIAEHKRALILTSATLSSGAAATPLVLGRIGLIVGASGDRIRSSHFGSPSDLKKHALVILVTDAPRAHDEAFTEWASGRISGMAQLMGGRVLGLFSSTRRVQEVGDRVRAQLALLGIEVLRPSRGNARALAAQQRDARTVLLSSQSFWQGADVPGRGGVSVVFIDQLPLEPESRPLVIAREALGGDASPRRLTNALLLLRNGMGRLVRSGQDRGVVIIADPGPPSDRNRVVAALEDYRVQVLPWAQARVRVFDEMRARGLVSLHAMQKLRAAERDQRHPRQDQSQGDDSHHRQVLAPQ